MANHKIEDVRNLLFETMNRLLDKKKPMDVDLAKAIAKTGAVIVESAKVEVAFMKQVGGLGTGFIPSEPKQLEGVQ